MSDKEKPAAGAGASRQKPGVKLDPLFHQKLKLIADDAGLELGALIEREMAEFVEREGKRITKKLFPTSD